MRSRDGNSYFSLRLCSIVLLSSLTLSAGEYLISYKYTIKNALLYSERLFVSKSMKKCKGTPYGTFTLKHSGKNNLQNIIKEDPEKFIKEIGKLGFAIVHNEKTINSMNDSTTTLTLKTTCFKVDFNDKFVILSALK